MRVLLKVFFIALYFVLLLYAQNVQSTSMSLFLNNPDEPALPDAEKTIYQHPRLAASLNTSLNPCDDFYSYVCDGWINTHPIPPTQKEVNQMMDLNDRIFEELKVELGQIELGKNREQSLAKIYFTKCLQNINNTSNEGVTAMFQRLSWIRQNTVFLTDWLMEMNPEVAVYDVLVAPDEYNSSVNIITLSPIEPVLSYSTYFDPAYAEEYVATRKSFFDLMNLLKEDDEMKDKFDYSPDGISRRVENFFTVDKMLTKIIKQGEDHPGSMSIPLPELQNFLPSVNWMTYFSAIFPAHLAPTLPFRLISLRDSWVMFKIEEMVNRLPPKWFIDYLEWKVIFYYVPFFNNKYNVILENYASKIYGVKGRDYERACLKQTISRFADVLSAIWVEKYYNESEVVKIIEMVDTVRANFLTLIDENVWMDEVTKKNARKKAYAIKSFIGYDRAYIQPDRIRDNYALVNYNENSTYYYICEAVSKNTFYLNFKNLEKINRRETFEAMPIDVNAFYDPTILAGILREPYFSPNWPDLLNFAGIGMVIGHEITHGFDNDGSYYDEFGNRIEWWAKATREKFDEKKACFENEYSSVRVVNDVKIDGQRTLGENIADNGGMRIAIRAALGKNESFSIQGLEKLSTDQIFFMTYAMTWCTNQRPFQTLSDLAYESHSPAKYRVNTVLANQPEFSSAFGCPLGSNMNSKPKCILW